MKTRWTALLLCMAVLLTTAPTAFAADPADSGFYSIGAADRVEILPVTADGQTVKAVSRNVDGEPGDELFYPAIQQILYLVFAVEGRDRPHLCTARHDAK